MTSMALQILIFLHARLGGDRVCPFVYFNIDCVKSRVLLRGFLFDSCMDCGDLDLKA